MKSLWEKRLKIAEYKELNDPFELLPFNQSAKEDRAHIDMVVKVLSSEHGVLCLSESWKSALMWAHYGEKHFGVCLGFEVEDGPHLTKIEYISKRLPSPIDFSKPLGGINKDMMEKCLNIKHSGWRYEKERRLRVELNDQRDGIYYSNFSDDMQLCEIIIGARSTLKIEDVAEAVGSQPDHGVKIWTARAAHGSFNMCMDKSKPISTIPGLDQAAKDRRKLADALRKIDR
jgi:hypothetical protein